MAEAPPMLCPTRTVRSISLSFRNSTASRAMSSKVISGTCGLLPWFLVSKIYTCYMEEGKGGERGGGEGLKNGEWFNI